MFINVALRNEDGDINANTKFSWEKFQNGFIALSFVDCKAHQDVL